MNMKRPFLKLTLCAAGSMTGLFASAQTPAPAAPVEVTLTRLDCGTAPLPADVARFSDTYALEGVKVQLTFSCYLIKHGNDYMVWDAGNPVGTTATAPKTSMVDLLGQLNVAPAQVKWQAASLVVGISEIRAVKSASLNAASSRPLRSA